VSLLTPESSGTWTKGAQLSSEWSRKRVWCRSFLSTGQEIVFTEVLAGLSSNACWRSLGLHDPNSSARVGKDRNQRKMRMQGKSSQWIEGKNLSIQNLFYHLLTWCLSFYI